MTRRAACAVILLTAGQAWAGAYYVPEIGGRAVGMAGAMTAESADPSTIFHNPAGLTALDGVQVQLSGDLVLPDIVSFRRPVADPGTGNTVIFASSANQTRAAAIPFLGAAFDLGHDLHAGFAAYVPFGATLEFPANGAQRFVVTEVALRALYAGPALAWQPTARLSIGASVSYIH